MRLSRNLFAVTALFSLAFAHGRRPLGDTNTDSLNIERRIDFEGLEMERTKAGVGSEPVFEGEVPAVFLEAQSYKKNATDPPLQDRSMELYKRQNCAAGYGYCAGMSALAVRLESFVN